MMKNYIQHDDMPPLSLSVHEDRSSEGITTRFDINLRSLRKDDEIRKKLARTGDHKTDHVPLLQTLDEWSGCLKRIIDAAIVFYLEDALPSAKQLLSYRTELQIGDKGHLSPIWLPKVEEKPDRFSFEIRMLPELKAKFIVEESERLQHQLP